MKCCDIQRICLDSRDWTPRGVGYAVKKGEYIAWKNNDRLES